MLPPHEAGEFSGILPAVFTREAVKYFVRHEWAISLEDILVRRSGWHYYFGNTGTRAETVAAWMGEIAEWTPTKQEDEVAAYRAAQGLFQQ